MDGSRFDAWTRRRFGLAAGGLTAAGFGLLSRQRGNAKSKKKCKKPRCQGLRQACEPNSKEQSCCQGLNCDLFASLGLICCLGRRQRCQASDQCCDKEICYTVDGLIGPRCCGVTGRFCTASVDCCSGYDCVDNGCAAQSDRSLKANVASVDPADMLRRVRHLPISTWTDTSDAAAIRHIGPMARKFYVAFGVGSDDQHIHPIDAQGVALAAMQGLIMEIEQLRDDSRNVAARVRTLERAPAESAGSGLKGAPP